MTSLEFYHKKLPVLDAMLDSFPIREQACFQEISFVCVQHLLFTTVNLMEALVQLGARPDNIHIMGKSYSSCPKVIDMLIENDYNYHPTTQQVKLANFAEAFQQDILNMWEKVYEDIQRKKIRLVVVLDDGGFCLRNVPDYIQNNYPLVGVEQTTSGLTNLPLQALSFPIIEVASSAAKQLIESPMIAEAVIKKLEDILPMDGKRLSCAVVGMGSIGTAISQKLQSLNHDVMIYDKDFEKAQAFDKVIAINNIEEILYKNEYIFGCSGKDITEHISIRDINTKKTFISCSSQDKEFLTLLKIFEQNNCSYSDVLDHHECILNNQLVKIFRGGFPTNLDNSGESVAAKDIQLTRGLLLAGIIQGVLYSLSSNSQQNVRYMLHPALQSFVVSQWRLYGSTNLFSPMLIDMFQSLPWVEENSRGTYMGNKIVEQYYSDPSLIASENSAFNFSNRRSA